MNTHALTHLFHEEMYRFTSPVVVVLAREWTAYSAEDQALLSRILSAVKIEARAVLLVRPALNLTELEMYSPARVIVFGSELPAEVPMYQQTSAQGFTMIRADDLSALDESKKKNLWTALKQMFSV